MKAIRVNADYEIELFQGKNGPPIVNESLEFLAFYLSEDPVLTKKKYSSEYLSHVEELTGRPPRTVAVSKFENWWGCLKDIPLERKLNSKLTSSKLCIEEGWRPLIFVVESGEDLSLLPKEKPLLFKDPNGMSGIGMKTYLGHTLPTAIKYPFIVEPVLKRKYDFSHYFFRDGTRIAYKNFVDAKFQYKGSLFPDLDRLNIENLDFYLEVESSKWNQFLKALDKIEDAYTQGPKLSGFSVDSFIYEEEGRNEIKYLCEVNYRRSLGRTAFELAKVLSRGKKWCFFFLAKFDLVDFMELRNKTLKLPGVFLLSPSDVRFQMFMICANSAKDGKIIYSELKSLLPEGQFSIDLEY